MQRRRRAVSVCLATLLWATLLFGGCSSTSDTEGVKESETVEEMGTGEAVEGSGETGAVSEPQTDVEEDAGVSGKSGLLHPEISSTVFSGTVTDEEDRIRAHYSYEPAGVLLSEEETLHYPALAGTLEARLNALLEQEGERVAELQEALSESEAADEEEIRYFMIRYTPAVQRADSRVFSIDQRYDAYLGGAHPDYRNIYTSYDTESGEPLKLSDVVSDGERFKESVIGALRMEYTYDELDFAAARAYLDWMYSGEELESYESGDVILEEDGAVWMLGYEGITVCFNPYAIAPYAFGQARVTLSYEDYPELVRDQYREVPENYAVALSPDTVFRADFDGDGVVDSLTYNILPGEEADGTQILSINLEDTGMDIYEHFYDVDGYCVKLGERYFLHLFLTGDSDYVHDQVLELSGNVVSDCGKAYVQPGVLGSAFDEAGAAGDYVYRQRRAAFTDPEAAYFSERVDMLSTYLAGRNYYMDEETGLPVSQVLLRLTEDIPLTVLKALEAIPVDETGKELGSMGEVILSPGEHLSIYATDGESFVIFRYGRDRYAKVSVQPDWPQQINGMPAEDVLEGMAYAG